MCVLVGGGRKTKRCLNAGRAAELGDGTNSGAARTDGGSSLSSGARRPPDGDLYPAHYRTFTVGLGTAAASAGWCRPADPEQVKPRRGAASRLRPAWWIKFHLRNSCGVNDASSWEFNDQCVEKWPPEAGKLSRQR